MKKLPYHEIESDDEIIYSSDEFTRLVLQRPTIPSDGFYLKKLLWRWDKRCKERVGQWECWCFVPLSLNEARALGEVLR